MSRSVRIGLVGATTALGQEIGSALADESDLDVAELRAFADAESEDQESDYESVMNLRSGTADFSGLDVVLMASSPQRALDEIRRALRSEVACIDCSGALLGAEEVPLLVAGPGESDSAWSGPLVSSPTDASLSWIRVLRVLDGEAGVVGVSGSVLHSASIQGHAGMEELSLQTLALLSQNEAPPAEVFPAQVAFDCFPHRAESEPEGDAMMAASEAKLRLSLRRSLGTKMRFSATSIQVPAFAGEGSALCVQTRDAVSADSVARWLEATPGICLAPDLSVASTRETVGSEDVWVARVRPDLSAADPQRSFLMWLSADPVRLAAQNALALAWARFSAN